MEIKMNAQVVSLPPVAMSGSKLRSASGAVSDEMAFDQSQALDQRLQEQPAVRAEVVAKAKELVSDVHYPPQETIRKIASLLAMNLDSTE